MMLVVDTSVAVKWVVPENGDGVEADTGIALSLLPRGLIAPDLMLVEFGNAMWKKVRKNEIPAEQAREALEILPTLVTFFPTRAFAVRAMEMSLEIDHPIYDCVFLALAEARELTVVTADKKLLRACESSNFSDLAVDLMAQKSWYE
jgi:predicted nucleic acid-binding protein